MIDLLCINPGGREAIYQDLGRELTAVEPPLWCRLIAAYCRERGHAVQIVDAEAENLSARSIGLAVAGRRPRLVAMVVYGHQPSASTQQMAAASDACRMIKAFAPGVPVVIVGGHVAALPERTLREEAVDFACNSEGPATVERLLAHVKGKIARADVPGLVWRDGAEIHANAAAPLLDVNTLTGDAWDLLPMKRYRAHNWHCFGNLSARQPYASIFTSLGCPFKCSFCCINAPFHSNRYRTRAPAAVVAEIAMLHERYGVSTFKIVDEMFVLNARHTSAICKGLTALPFARDLNIWAYARIDTVKPAQLASLRAAGIRWLALGIESGSAHVRDGAEKTLGDADIRATVHAIQAAGINVIGNFIFGLPDDTRESLRATLDLALELNCEFANFYAAMAYPGSKLYDDAMRDGLPLPGRWSGFSQHSPDCHPLPTATLSAAEVLQFRDDAFREYFAAPRYLDMVAEKFGHETVAHIHQMSGRALRRELLT